MVVIGRSRALGRLNRQIHRAGFAPGLPSVVAETASVPSRKVQQPRKLSFEEMI
jgi:hypothetical protein